MDRKALKVRVDEISQEISLLMTEFGPPANMSEEMAIFFARLEGAHTCMVSLLLLLGPPGKRISSHRCD